MQVNDHVQPVAALPSGPISRWSRCPSRAPLVTITIHRPSSSAMCRFEGGEPWRAARLTSARRSPGRPARPRPERPRTRHSPAQTPRRETGVPGRSPKSVCPGQVAYRTPADRGELPRTRNNGGQNGGQNRRSFAALSSSSDGRSGRADARCVDSGLTHRKLCPGSGSAGRHLS
jgi:hypothetical protein